MGQFGYSYYKMERREHHKHIQDWLKGLARESWQLELLLSAFTIFLLIQSAQVFGEFITHFTLSFSMEGPPVFVLVFLRLVYFALKALTVFLILHLLIRGFWIGAIGLRSVQENVDYTKLNYSGFFTEKLKTRIMSLDELVVLLDEICSVIFSLAFLIISNIISFGLYMMFLGLFGFIMSSLLRATDGIFKTIVSIVGVIVGFSFFLASIVYFLDYLTFGFFKKYRFTSRWYWPIYRFFGAITLSFVSRSIYYYLISRFSKARVRLFFLTAGALLVLTTVATYESFPYFPENNDANILVNNYYDNLRPEGDYIFAGSLSSHIVSQGHFDLYLRYDPGDNDLIRSHCPEFRPLKKEGFNWLVEFVSTGPNFQLTGIDYTDESSGDLLRCLSGIYQVVINDTIYPEPDFLFYEHPAKSQKGIHTTLSSEGLPKGRNFLKVRKLNPDSLSVYEHFITIPFWVQK